jgi:hypothetical protein
MLGDGDNFVALIASPPPESFPPCVAVLEGGEDDDVAKCPITLATPHEALHVAVAHRSRGYPDIFGEILGKQLGPLRPGLRLLLFANGTWFASDELFDLVKVVHHASFQRVNSRIVLLFRKSLVYILSGNPILALDSTKSFSREDVL